MRLWIAAFFFFLFACQALPIAALGKAIAKTQVSTSDDNAAADDEGDGNGPDAIKLKKAASPMEDFVPYGFEASLCLAIQTARVLLLHRADHLPVLYAGEVATPPPNFC